MSPINVIRKTPADIIHVDDLQVVKVQEVTVRDFPALRVYFPAIPGLLAHFVADQDEDPQIVFILDLLGDGNLRDYIEGGRGNYTSDAVVRNADGNLRFDGIVENGLTKQSMEQAVAEQIQAEADGEGDDNPNFFLITGQATSVQQEVLDAVVAASPQGREFFDQHVPAVSADETRVLIRAIASEYMVEHTKDLRVTPADAEAFAQRVVDRIPEYRKEIEEEEWA